MAVVGAGYWGPSLARKFQSSVAWDLVALCDRDLKRAHAVADRLGGIPVAESLDELLDTFEVDAVAIATPARNHYGTVMTALRAGKHVLVEEPIADSLAHGLDMFAEAESRSLVLMADHTSCFAPAVLKMHDLVQAGSLGELLFVDSVTAHPGPEHPDVDVFWDLAPRALAILDFVLPGGLNPGEVSAFGADPLGTGRDCLGHLNFRLPNDVAAHVQVTWLGPAKTRQLVMGGSLRTLIWDDERPQPRLSVHERGVSLSRRRKFEGEPDAPAAAHTTADVWSPTLPDGEPLGQLVQELASCIRNKRETRIGGGAGLRVLSVLEAAARSLSLAGQASAVDANAYEDPDLAATGVRLERAG